MTSFLSDGVADGNYVESSPTFSGSWSVYSNGLDEDSKPSTPPSATPSFLVSFRRRPYLEHLVYVVAVLRLAYANNRCDSSADARRHYCDDDHKG